MRRILGDPRLAGRPFVIETPGPEAAWREQLELLRGRRPAGRQAS